MPGKQKNEKEVGVVTFDLSAYLVTNKKFKWKHEKDPSALWRVQNIGDQNLDPLN